MDLADRRFRLLIEQYCEDQKIDMDAHGAKARVAREFGGLDPSTISKIWTEERGVGEAVRDKAAKALRLDPMFFKVSSLAGRPRYSDWQGAIRIVRDVHEMAGVTTFFDDKKNEHLRRFRATVNAELHSSTGDIPVSRVRQYVGILIGEEEAGVRQFE